MISKALAAASLKPFILSLLARGDSYGYEIIQQVHDLTNGEVRWTTGTLYPLLHNLENKGLITSFQREAEDGPGPKRTYYRLTNKGTTALVDERQQWLNVHQALTKLWEPMPGLTPA